jgi:hypothetical protein
MNRSLHSSNTDYQQSISGLLSLLRAEFLGVLCIIGGALLFASVFGYDPNGRDAAPLLYVLMGWTAPLFAVMILVLGCVLLLGQRAGYWSAEALVGAELLLLGLALGAWVAANRVVTWTPRLGMEAGGLVGWARGRRRLLRQRRRGPARTDHPQDAGRLQRAGAHHPRRDRPDRNAVWRRAALHRAPGRSARCASAASSTWPTTWRWRWPRHAVRIEAPVPGRPYVGHRSAQPDKSLVSLRGIMESAEMRKGGIMALPLGRNTAGAPVVMDLTKAPHMLIAGATGSGKSVCINTIIAGLLMQHGPESCASSWSTRRWWSCPATTASPISTAR